MVFKQMIRLINPSDIEYNSFKDATIFMGPDQLMCQMLQQGAKKVFQFLIFIQSGFSNQQEILKWLMLTHCKSIMKLK